MVRGKEQSCGRDLLGTRQRRHRSDLLPGFGGALLRRILIAEHRGVDRARAYHVSPDLPIFEFVGPSPDERTKRRFAGAISAAARHAFVLAGGRHEDDGGPVIQVRQCLLNGEISAACVCVEGLVEMLGRRCGGHRLLDEGRSRKNHIDLAFFRDGLVKAVEVVELGDIGLYAGDVRADLCDGLVDLGLAAAGDKHVGALFNEPLGGREADAAAAAGDDGNLVFQLRHVVSFSVRRGVRRAAAGAPSRPLPQHL